MFHDPNAFLQEERNFPPAHFTLKVESYSLLLEALKGQGEGYESGIFEVGGLKWKLILYPFGDKTCERKGYLSLNLALDGSNTFPNNSWIVGINLKLFVLNQNTMKYLTIQDANGRAIRYFGKLRTEQGCPQLVSHHEFNDPHNGYLVNDCCVFGAEVVIIQPSSGYEETLTMVKDPEGKTHTWSIKNFSKFILRYSHEFTVGGRKWKFLLYPRGRDTERGKSLSLYLVLADVKSVVPERKVYADFKLRVVDDTGVKKVEKTASHLFDSAEKEWGFTSFMALSDIRDHGKGYLNNDTLIVEVEIDVISIIKVRP